MAPRLPNSGNILGVDYGDKRTGLALAGAVARLPRPHKSVASKEAISAISQAIKDEDVSLVVIGLPRSLEGGETQQTQKTRQFADELKQSIGTDVAFADEALSSVRAEKYIKDNKAQKNDKDSVAACFILEEHLGVRS